MAVIGRDQVQTAIDAASRAGAGLRGFFRRPDPARRNAEPDRPAARRLVEIVLAALIGLALARLVWALVAPSPLPDAAPAIAPQPAAREAARHPFRVAATPAETGEATDEADETTLNLVLHGVWVEADGRASAIIRTPDGRQTTFSTGDDICCGATLDRVYADRVTILRAGVRESLSLSRRDASGQAARPAQPAPQGAGVAAEGGATFQRLVRLHPRRDAAGVLRLSLYPGEDENAFRAAGLRPGDVLVSIGGRAAPADPAAAAQLLPQLEGATIVDVEVERGGVRLPLRVDLTGNGAVNE